MRLTAKQNKSISHCMCYIVKSCYCLNHCSVFLNALLIYSLHPLLPLLPNPKFSSSRSFSLLVSLLVSLSVSLSSRSPAQGYSNQVILQAGILLANEPRWISWWDQGWQQQFLWVTWHHFFFISIFCHLLLIRTYPQGRLFAKYLENVSDSALSSASLSAVCQPMQRQYCVYLPIPLRRKIDQKTVGLLAGLFCPISGSAQG